MIQARVKCLLGDRAMCDFVARAGLGITGIGYEHVIEIDYDEDVQDVPVFRVRSAMEHMKNSMDKEDNEMKLLSYEVLEIKTVHYDGEA